MSWQEWLPLKLFEVFNHLRQFFKALYTSSTHNPEVCCDVGFESAPRCCFVLFSFSSFGIKKVEISTQQTSDFSVYVQVSVFRNTMCSLRQTAFP